MGNKGSKITYETVDRTDQNAANQGQQQAREDNDRRLRELQGQIVREHENAILEAQQQARCEDESQRRRLDQQKRRREKRERQMKEEKEYRELQTTLMNYDFQKCPRIRKESFRDLGVGDIDLVRIALIGPTGSGKTSFVGTLQRALKEPQSAFEQGTGREGTIHLEEYYVQKQVRLVDTRGFFESDEKLFEECLNIMSGRIRPGEEIVRNYDPGEGGIGKDSQVARKVEALAKFAHGVIFVVKANDPRLKDGKYKDMLKKIREHFRKDGYAPVTVITYLDSIRDDDNAKENAFDMASVATGSSRERTYFIANYIHERSERSFAVERAALDILDSALISAESFIRIRKQREKNQKERELAVGGGISSAETLEQFFARLKKKYNWNDQGHVKEVVPHLRSRDINTVRVLKELWKDVKPELPLSIGMKLVMEEEIHKI